MNWIAIYKRVFRTPSADAMALNELEEAKRELLQAQTSLDYAAAMVEYQTNRVQRLSAIVSQNAILNSKR
jgi:hypothetical protein